MFDEGADQEEEEEEEGQKKPCGGAGGGGASASGGGAAVAASTGGGGGGAEAEAPVFYVEKGNGWRLVAAALERRGWRRLPFEYKFRSKGTALKVRDLFP